MKGTLDRILDAIREKYADAAKRDEMFSSLAPPPPSSAKIIGDLTGSIAKDFFGKDYLEAMAIVMQAHWFVAFNVDAMITVFFFPGKPDDKVMQFWRALIPDTPMQTKILFIEKNGLLAKKTIEKLRGIHVARNKFAHFYPRSDSRMNYGKTPIFTDSGLEKFWRDCEVVIDESIARMLAQKRSLLED